MPVVFASGATLDANGVPVQVVDAISTTPPSAAEAPETEEVPQQPDGASHAPDGSTETPAEPADGSATDETTEEPVEREQAEDTEQGFNESNRGFRQRILNENRDLRREKRDDRALITYLQQQLDQLKQGPAEPQPTIQQPQQLPGLPPRPQQTDYGTYTEYEDALLQWHDYRRYAQQVAQQQAQASQAAQAEWQRKEDQGRQKYHDYDQVLGQAAFAASVAPILRAAVLESPQGSDLLYYLAKHPDDLNTFNGLTPYAAARWLADLETKRLIQGTTRNGTSRTAPPAPRPIAPVGTGVTVPVTGFRQGMSLQEYEAMRVQQRKGAG